MPDPVPIPDASTRFRPAPSRPGVRLATAFGLGYAPWAPGTAGSLAAVALFGLLLYALEGIVLQFFYLSVLAWLIPAAWWSTEHALKQWNTSDPQAIVIDEVVGQWLAYAGTVLAPLVGWPDGAAWKSLGAGFILFRAFDVLKPFPIRRSERLAGAAGVVVDDLLAGVYAAAGVLLLTWAGWLK